MLLSKIRSLYRRIIPKRVDPAPISDPLIHETRLGRHVREDRSLLAHPDIICAGFTTGEFSKGENGKRYRSHCAPTAITSLLFTFYNRGLAPVLTDRLPRDIFEECAALGSHRALYWNMSVLGYFGGVLLPLTGLYLRLCLRRYDVHPRVLRPHYLFPKKSLIQALEKGHIALICVLFHPTYHSHTMFVQGLKVLKNDAGKDVYYVRVADGWSHLPRYLALDELKCFAFWEVN